MPAPKVFTLSGLYGGSAGSDRHSLYFHSRLAYQIKITAIDVLAVESIAPDQLPFVGANNTQVTPV